ncbi:unnamed protein product [Adineta steineri]|uniref:Uncharacterized protein n=1 Tax=Adineta steineri TaxID=433720 RepID=A0A813RNB0_9BILA|nr:unnamed protein product [Adineta steineri]
MLNAIPDTRKSADLVGGFLTPNEIVSVDANHGGHEQDDQFDRESINMSERRQSSVYSSKSETSSVIVPQVDSPDELVQRPIYDGGRFQAVQSRTPWLRLLAECVAELFGTAILVVIGCSGIAQFTLSKGVLSSFLSVNFAFGFGALIAVYVAGPVSGAHINPAVSIAMLSLRSITPLQCITYCISQFIGAFIAAALVFGTYYDAINKFDGGTRQVTGALATAGIFGTLPAQGVSQISLFFDQVLSTALLLIGICSLSNKRNKLVANSQIPIAVGFIIIAIGVSFGYNCGFPINPARDLGPRLLSLCVGYGTEVFSVGNYYFWIPCIGPIFGALLGAWAYHGYSKLMKIHIGEDDKEITRARYQVDVQNVSRIYVLFLLILCHYSYGLSKLPLCQCECCPGEQCQSHLMIFSVDKCNATTCSFEQCYKMYPKKCGLIPGFTNTSCSITNDTTTTDTSDKNTLLPLPNTTSSIIILPITILMNILFYVFLNF